MDANARETVTVRSKRRTRNKEAEDKWECSVCTYINPMEAYKCQICSMRKGTSTRKPRLNPQVFEQQQFIAKAILKEKDDELRKKRIDHKPCEKLDDAMSVNLNNFDRSSPLLFEIFANGYSVVITEFPTKHKTKGLQYPHSPAPSNCSSMQSYSGTPSTHLEQLSPSDSPEPSHRIVPPAFSVQRSFDHFEFKTRLSSCSTNSNVGQVRDPILSYTSSFTVSNNQVPSDDIYLSATPHTTEKPSISKSENDSVLENNRCPKSDSLGSSESDAVPDSGGNRLSYTARPSRGKRRTVKRNMKTKLYTFESIRRPFSSNSESFSKDSSFLPPKRRKKNSTCGRVSRSTPAKIPLPAKLLSNSISDSLIKSPCVVTSTARKRFKKDQNSSALLESPDNQSVQSILPSSLHESHPDGNGNRSATAITNDQQTRTVVSSTSTRKSCDRDDKSSDISSLTTSESISLPARLSSGSKNTTAMTDSTGASALEISG